MPESLKLLMLGLSESGKTTFLAALYELVNRENAIEGSLIEREQLADREYFFEIRRRWLAFEPLLHSQRSTDEVTVLALETADGAHLDLEVPDIAGESFDYAWAGEEWPDSVAEHAMSADGILVFVRADSMREPTELPPGDGLQEVQVDPLDRGDVGGHQEIHDEDWAPEDSPTQTKLADLLEAIEDSRHQLVPTAVIISAWDTLPDAPNENPRQWLEYEAPLLWQMLEGRDGERPFEIFGVSAQGGDISDDDVVAELAKRKPEIERVMVKQGEDAPHHDISAPIRWLSSLFA